MSDDLDTVIRSKYAHGALKGLALIVAACDAPMFLIQYPDGQQEWWRQDLCFGAKESEQTEYWRQRANALEIKLAQEGPKP